VVTCRLTHHCAKLSKVGKSFGDSCVDTSPTVLIILYVEPASIWRMIAHLKTLDELITLRVLRLDALCRNHSASLSGNPSKAS